MDRLSRLIPFVVALLVFAAGTLPRVAFASWTGMSNTQSEAAAACNADGKSLVDQNKADFPNQVSKANPHYTCVSRTGSCDNYGWIGCYTLSFYVYDEIRGGGVYGWGIQDAPPKNPCDGIPSMRFNYAGSVVGSVSKCVSRPQPDGSSVMCGFTFKAEADPISNGNGTFNTWGTMSFSGNVCGSNGDGGNDWTNQDGTKPQPQPPAPPAAPADGASAPADPVPPKTCGDISCYDPKTDQYCTQGSNGTLCTKGAPGGANSGGSCSSNADMTLCSGSPQAPKPPVNRVPDPPTATEGTDKYTRATPSTGDVYNVTTTVYSNTGANASNGAGSGDVKPPASSSSSSSPPQGEGDKNGDGTSASGGANCDNPPSVEGSAALAMIARQMWLVRCAGGEANLSDTSVPGLDQGVPDSASDAAGVKDGSSLFDRLDFSGLVGGGATCPQPLSIDIPQWGFSYHTAPDTWCTALNALGLLLMGFAVYSACCILGGK